MSKRSEFKRRKHDKYHTPLKPVLYLLPHLERGTEFIEPCAGNGALVRILERAGHRCVFACDIRPERATIVKRDARTLTRAQSRHAQLYITNPPWTRSILHELIDCLTKMLPCWFLFDADWAHTIQARPYIDRCAKIVSAGRVKWIAKSKYQGKDNCAWYYFPRWHRGGPQFVGLIDT